VTNQWTHHPDSPPTVPTPRHGEPPWWSKTVNLGIVAVLSVVAIVKHADAAVIGASAAMVAAALGWTGPWPTITLGGRHEPP
jgi:hypothetical protein